MDWYSWIYTTSGGIDEASFVYHACMTLGDMAKILVHGMAFGVEDCIPLLERSWVKRLGRIPWT